MEKSVTLFYQKWDFPVGEIYVGTDGEFLRVVAMNANWSALKSRFESKSNSVEQKAHPIIAQTISQLEEYFAGQRKEFDIPLHLEGTEFQVSTWNALRKIPYGQTISYAQQAASIGRPAAVRAVGSANGRNPIAIIIPCHRVIAKSGELGGFASGLCDKKFLLDLEKE